MAKLTGPQVRELQEALLDAFDRAALEDLLLALDRQYDFIVPQGSTLPDSILSIIKAAEMGDAEGRWTADLLSQAAVQRPHNLLLQNNLGHLRVWLEAPDDKRSFHGLEAEADSHSSTGSGDSSQGHMIKAEVGQVRSRAQVAIGVNIRQESVAARSLSALLHNCHADVICKGSDEGRNAIHAVTVGIGFEYNEDFGWRNVRADVFEVLF